MGWREWGKEGDLQERKVSHFTGCKIRKCGRYFLKENVLFFIRNGYPTLTLTYGSREEQEV
jgi:hypothetical protein